MSEILQIDTPENVAFGYKVAGLGSRFMAAIVDTLLIAVLEGLAYVTMFLVIFDASDEIASWMVAVSGLVAFLFLWGYYIFFELLWNGQSPGKRWVGLRVIRTDGMPITLAETLIRNLVRLVDFLPVGYGVGIVTMFVNDQSRRLGDLAAGTLVIYDHRLAPALPAAHHPPIALRDRPDEASPVAGMPVDRLSDQEIFMIEEYFSRRSGLVRGEVLALRILDALYQKMGIADRVTDPRAADKLLAEIWAAVSRRGGGS